MQSIKRYPALYSLLVDIRGYFGQKWMRLMNRVYGVKPKRVFFSSFKGKAYSDSPRWISEALHNICPEAEIVWQLDDNAERRELPDYVRTVRPHTLAALKEISTARVLVDNFNRPQYMLKFRGQRYVQTWHGDRGFKKALYDMGVADRFPDYAQIDLGVSGSDFGTRFYRTAFRYSGEVMQTGMPRNDALVRRDMSRVALVRERYGIAPDVRLLLYAPTFRDATSGKTLEAGFDVRRAIAVLEETSEEKWACLVRAHDQNRGVVADGAIDVTDYPEMSDLLLAADALITDYSSSAGDYFLLNRPVILYQPDLQQFMQTDRSMYFDIRKCPYARAESPEELYRLLAKYPFVPMSFEALRDFYGVTEYGGSAERVAMRIIQWLREE